MIDEHADDLYAKALPSQRAERIRVRSRHRRASRLAILAMAGETAWLDGMIVWRDGRVAWQVGERFVTPDGPAISLAQRRLNQIARHPHAAARALGDPTDWLERRRLRLDLAKCLHTSVAPDLPRLVEAARTGDASAVRRLVALLPAEALCLDGLPRSPGAALVACGRAAIAPLREALRREQVPDAGRALAALVLGAIDHRTGERTFGMVGTPGGEAAQLPDALREPWPRRAYTWGLRWGYDEYPALTTALLAHANGSGLTARCLDALDRGGQWRLPPRLLRHLLDRRVAPERVVALAEAAATCGADLEERLHALPLARRPTDALAALLHDYASATADPATIQAVAGFSHMMLTVCAPTIELGEAIVATLRHGARLPPERQLAYLAILCAQHERLWDRSTLPDDPKARVHWWQQRHGRTVATLLDRTADPRLVAEAVELGIDEPLSLFTWRDQDMYRLLVTLVRTHELGHDHTLAVALCNALDRLGAVRRARPVLGPFIQALPPGQRRHLLRLALHDVDDVSRDLPRLMPYLSRLAAVAERRTDGQWRRGPLVSVILELDHAVPDRAGVWLDWLLSYQDEMKDTPQEGHVTGWTLQGCVRFGLAIADRNVSAFQDAVRAAARHRLGDDPVAVDAGIAALRRVPTLRPVLARNLPRHPRRCLDLLQRLAQATRLRAAAPASLATLDNLLRADIPAFPPAWQSVLDTAPGLAPLVARYLHARRMRGSSVDVPPGVRRALERPRTLAHELAHLERLLAEQPGHPRRTHLALRTDSLRRQLSGPDHASLLAAARTDAEECLGGLTDEAELSAAEHAVLEPFRVRLRALVGALPSGDAALSDDVLNAVLLAGEIRPNRRLLLRLLRAYVAGDRLWPRSQPANVAYLDGLRARGVDVSAWLGDHRRAYRCGGVAGGRVRLRVERDPLRILQMGNIFGTCLSYNAFNAFSTVANACELNKRVIYAYDGHGRVVGRKLIGIERSGRLVGFRTYTSLDDKESNARLRSVVRDYARRFAAACHLELADEGEVPTLLASRWYDDGTVPWEDDDGDSHGPLHSPPTSTAG